MNKQDKSILLQILERISSLHLHIESVECAQRIASGEYGRGPLAGVDLRAALIERELNEWRKLLMFGLVGTDEERERIKAATYDRFFGKERSVAHWLTESGEDPCSWMAVDEDEFREKVRKLFAPKLKEE